MLERWWCRAMVKRMECQKTWICINLVLCRARTWTDHLPLALWLLNLWFFFTLNLELLDAHKPDHSSVGHCVWLLQIECSKLNCCTAPQTSEALEHWGHIGGDKVDLIPCPSMRIPTSAETSSGICGASALSFRYFSIIYSTHSGAKEKKMVSPRHLPKRKRKRLRPNLCSAPTSVLLVIDLKAKRN